MRRLVKGNIPPVWVHGTVSSLQERGKVVYITLAEYEEDSVLPKASLGLVIFSAQYAALNRRLSMLPVPFSIKKDLRIKVLIEADFYIPQGKFQCVISDIDETFTIGEIVITRTKIWERLVSENLSRLNARLPLPLLPLNIGLITAENSAAYNDFVSTIKASGFAFNINTVSAKMQGQNTEADIIEALGKLREIKDLDVVCIIRGGGSKTDLIFFDSYALCRAAAIFPLPVLTGIGHEIDESLLDKVAHTRLITPTDCANFLIERVFSAWQRLQTLSLELESLSHIFARERERLARNTLGLKRGVPKMLDYQMQILKLLEEKTHAANPETQLKRGYTITKDKEGKILRSANINPNSIIKTTFADGETFSVVKAQAL